MVGLGPGIPLFVLFLEGRCGTREGKRGRKEVSACGEEGVRVPHIFSRKCCLVSFLTPLHAGEGVEGGLMGMKLPELKPRMP